MRVRVLIEGRDLLRAAATRESADREAHAREIHLSGPRVVHALAAAERERGTARVEVMDAHVEAFVLVRDEDRVVPVRREFPRHDVAGAAPRVLLAEPPLLRWHERRSRGLEDEE